jgi:hypothetical protein
MDAILGSPLFMMMLILTIVVIPISRIVKRTGHSAWWSLLVFVPLANFIGLWMLAFSQWPAIDRSK